MTDLLEMLVGFTNIKVIYFLKLSWYMTFYEGKQGFVILCPEAPTWSGLYGYVKTTDELKYIQQ